MSGEFLRTYLTIEKELKVLRSNVARCAAFQAELREASERPGSTSDFANQAIWTFGDLDTMVKLAKDLGADVSAFGERTLAQRRKTTELQSQLLKAEVKREEAARFIRARSDPDFAKLVRVRQLGPEHAESQLKLRKATQATKEALAALEEHIAVLKRRVQDDKLGKTQGMKAPTLDSMRRTVRNITAMTLARKNELDLLTKEFEATLDGRAESEFNSSMLGRRSVSRGPDGLDMSLLNATLPSASPAASRSAAGAAASAAVASRRSADEFQAAFLDALQEPLLNNDSANEGKSRRGAYSAAELDIAFARGPAHISAPAIAAAFAASSAPPSKPASRPSSPWQQAPAAQSSPSPWPQQPQQSSPSPFGAKPSPFAPPTAMLQQPPPQQQQPASSPFNFGASAPLPPSLFTLPPEPAPFAPGSRSEAQTSTLRGPAKTSKRASKAVSLPPSSGAAPSSGFSFAPDATTERSASPSMPPPVAVSDFFSRPSASPAPAPSFAGSPAKPNFFANFNKPASAPAPASSAPLPAFSFGPAAAAASKPAEAKPALAPSAFTNAAQRDEEEDAEDDDEDEDGEWEAGDDDTPEDGLEEEEEEEDEEEGLSAVDEEEEEEVDDDDE